MSYRAYKKKKGGAALATSSTEDLKKEIERRELNLNPFPIDVFPRKLDPFIGAMVKDLRCESCFVGGGLLAAFSAAIGTYYKAHVTDSWGMHLTTWMCDVGISSAGKSMTERHVLAPLYGIQKSMEEENRQMERDAANSEDDSYTRPKRNEIIIQNTTFEAMVKESMVDNPKGLLKHEDELTSWLDGMKQYSKTDLERKFWLSAWSNSPYKMRRSGGKYVYLDKPYASVLGGTQPFLLGKFFEPNLLMEGFTARMLFNMPDEDQVLASDPYYEFPEAPQKDYKHLIENLHGLQVYFDSDPQKIKINRAGAKIFNDWQMEIMRNINSISDLDPVPKEIAAMIFGKLKEYCIKFAAILTIAEYACLGERFDNIQVIEPDCMRSATRLVDYYYKSFQRAYLTAIRRDFVPLDVLELARLYKANYSYRQMAKKLSIPETTLRRKLQRYIVEYPSAFGSKAK